MSACSCPCHTKNDTTCVECCDGPGLDLSFAEISTLLNIVEWSIREQRKEGEDRTNHHSLAFQHTIAGKLADEQRRTWPSTPDMPMQRGGDSHE